MLLTQTLWILPLLSSWAWLLSQYQTAYVKVFRIQTGEKILFRAIKPSSVVKSLIIFGKTSKENSVETLSMNRNINILGMYYVNSYFSGVLDKINGSKEQALKAVVEISVCVLCPLKAQNSQPMGTMRSCSPLLLLGSLTLLRPQYCSVIPKENLFSPLSLAVFVHMEECSTMAKPACVSPLCSPGYCMARQDQSMCGWHYSKPNLCAEANIWGGSSLALANTFRYFRIADNELSR